MRADAGQFSIFQVAKPVLNREGCDRYQSWLTIFSLAAPHPKASLRSSASI